MTNPAGTEARPHQWPWAPGNHPDGDILAWVCAACGQTVQEFGPREPDDCPVDWRKDAR